MKQIVPILISLFLTFASNGSKQSDISVNKESTKGDLMTYRVKQISISINRPPDDVYQFASNPENFPKWVEFVRSITRHDDVWIGKTDSGDIKIGFPPKNKLGVIDHQVTLPGGETFNNPMRVVANNKGSEFTFTLFWMPGRTEGEFEEDAKAVAADLQKLKEIMEK